MDGHGASGLDGSDRGLRRYGPCAAAANAIALQQNFQVARLQVGCQRVSRLLRLMNKVLKSNDELTISQHPRFDVI